MRERFRDGAGILATYDFTVNHFEEEGLDLNRNVTRSAVTTGPAFVLQQGESTRGTLRYSGTILTQEQYDAMTAYYNACQTRTIFFREFTGVEHEVLITRFNPLRRWTARNQRDLTNAPFHYWTYSLEMEVIT